MVPKKGGANMKEKLSTAEIVLFVSVTIVTLTNLVFFWVLAVPRIISLICLLSSLVAYISIYSFLVSRLKARRARKKRRKKDEK
jgi:hypothetical protein